MISRQARDDTTRDRRDLFKTKKSHLVREGIFVLDGHFEMVTAIFHAHMHEIFVARVCRTH